MKRTTSQQELLERLDRLPLSGISVLVDAGRFDAAAATELVAALRAMIGNDGTLIMPAFTSERTLSGFAEQPLVFHGDLEIDAGLGSVAETFRRQASTLRSSHPTNSFSASGARAQMLLSTNRDNNPLGPVKKLNLLNAFYLRIGLPSDSPADATGVVPTPLHLAELQSLSGLRYRGTAQRLNLAGYAERVVIEHVATCTSGFAAVESTLASTDCGLDDDVALVRLRDLVRAAAAAISSAPEQLLCGRDDCSSCADRRAAIAAGVRV